MQRSWKREEHRWWEDPKSSEHLTRARGWHHPDPGDPVGQRLCQLQSNRSSLGLSRAAVLTALHVSWILNEVGKGRKAFQTKGPDTAGGGAWQLSLARDGDGKGRTSCEVPGAMLRGLDFILSQMF